MSQASESVGWLDKVSIRRKVIGAFTIVLALFVGATSAAFWFALELDDARVSTDHTYEVLVAVGELRSGMWAQESGLRGYVITGNRAFLTPYTDGNMHFDKAFKQLQRLTSDNPSQQARLGRINELENRWQKELAQREFALLEQGRVEEAQQIIADGKGKALLDALRGLFGELALAEHQLLVEREALFSQISQLAFLTMMSLLAGGLIVGLLAVFGVSRQITEPLGELTDDMARIADGEFSLDVPYRHRRDEMGEMARALEHFRQVSISNASATWVRENLTALRLLAQQASDEKQLAQTILDELSPMIGARYAALFVQNEINHRFDLLAGFGYTPSEQVPSSFASGEGLVGQCARQRKIMLLNDVPENYINVVSGLGRAKPIQLILAPVVYADEVVAVLEIGLFQELRDRDMELLEELLPSTALSLSRLKRQHQTLELLDETRAQSEELQASEEELRNQQDALRRTNDDLSKQSERLRASEEELKVQSEELQATNEELRQKGDLLTAQKDELELARCDLEKKAEALAQASQYKSEFLANMSHELRTPLNSLLILARSLADNDSGHLDEEEVEAASIVHDSGANLLRLINDILDLSKVEAGKLHAHVESLPLAALKDRLQRNFVHVAAEKNLGYSISLASDAPESIETDSGKLEQIINNLLGNAFKFTKEGAVHVSIGRPSPDMQLRTAGLVADKALCISVADHGIGIPEDKLDKIFQAFEQVDASTSRVYGGTGLGLSISQRLAQLLGGEVHLESVKDKGSTFSVVVPEFFGGQTSLAPVLELQESSGTAVIAPLAKQSETLLAEAFIDDDREALDPGERSILVIEDDPAFAKLLRDDAHRKGFKCLVAGSGETGLALARNYQPMGIMLDIGLPGIDGWAVLDQLKDWPETQNIPVHILSAGDDTGRGKKMGAIGYLPKPATREGLETVFSKLVAVSDGPRKRLLVIDDEAAARAAVQALLKNQNIEITYADSAEAGLQKLANTAHDCVVLDLNLPDMSGFELLEKISARENSPPVIVYSARDLADDENLRLRAHTDSIVIKGRHSNKRLIDEVNLFLHSISATSKPAKPAPRVMDKELAGKNVLLVDDDMRNTFALSRVLRAKGMRVIMAQDGLKALDQLANQADVDIVLMDIMMPGMDGYETMRRIREQEKFRKLPMLALTAKAMKGDREKCIEAGASDYLSKPIDTDKLLSMMRAWI